MVEKIGSGAGIGVLLLLIVSGLVKNHELLLSMAGSMFAAAIGLGVLGFALGHLGAAVLGMNKAQRRAVAFETGIQNSPLALGILMLSFPDQDRMLWLPLLYALFVLLSASLLTLIYRRAR